MTARVVWVCPDGRLHPSPLAGGEGASARDLVEAFVFEGFFGLRMFALVS